MISIKTQFTQPWPFPGTFKMPTGTTAMKVKLATDAVRAGVSIVHIFDRDKPKGGMTIAFRKTNDYKSGDMVEFAIANCSTEDTFSKKVGTAIAINNFLTGKTTQLPILRTAYDKRDINGAVKSFFHDMYHVYLTK